MKAIRTFQEKVSASRLRGISIYAEDDLYDFARLFVRVLKAKDTAEAGNGVFNRSYMTVHGLIGAFAGVVTSIEPIQERVEEAVATAGVSLDAVVVPDEELESARTDLAGALQTIANPVNHIYLVGVVGVGKTTIGGKLAQRLGYDFFDLDQEVARAFGMSVSRVKGHFPSAKEYDRESAKILRRIIKECKMTNFVLALPADGLIGPHRIALGRDNRLVIGIHDRPEAIFERAEFFDVHGNREEKVLTDWQKRDLMNDIKNDIEHFEETAHRADLRVHLDGAGVDASVAKIEQAIWKAVRVLGDLPNAPVRLPARRGKSRS